MNSKTSIQPNLIKFSIKITNPFGMNSNKTRKPILANPLFDSQLKSHFQGPRSIDIITKTLKDHYVINKSNKNWVFAQEPWGPKLLSKFHQKPNFDFISIHVFKASNHITSFLIHSRNNLEAKSQIKTLSLSNPFDRIFHGFQTTNPLQDSTQNHDSTLPNTYNHLILINIHNSNK